MKRVKKKQETKNWRTIMKSKKLTTMRATMKVALACVAIGWMCWSAGNTCNAQTPPSNLSPDLQEVVKLSQEKMSDDVITTYIRNSGKTFKLGADEIIYLNSQGVSQGVISALLQTASSGGNPANQTPSPVVASSPPPPEPTPAPQAMVSAPAPQVEAPAPPAPEINFALFSRSTCALRHLDECGRHDVLASGRRHCRQSRLASLL